MARALRPWWLFLVAVLLALGVSRWLLSEEPPPPPEREAAPARTSEIPTPPQAAAGPEPESAEAPTAGTRRDAVRTLLEADLAEHFPDRKLSSDELDAAADALMRLRAARLELKALPRTRENAERIRELTAELGQASADFEYLVDLDPIAFTEQASGGFDADDDDDEETE